MFNVRQKCEKLENTLEGIERRRKGTTMNIHQHNGTFTFVIFNKWYQGCKTFSKREDNRAEQSRGEISGTSHKVTDSYKTKYIHLATLFQKL